MMKKLLTALLIAAMMTTALCAAADGAEDAAVAACNARMAEILPEGAKIAPVCVDYDQGEIPGAYCVEYRQKTKNFTLKYFLEYDPAVGEIAQESKSADIPIKKNDAMYKAEKALIKAAPDPDEEDAKIPQKETDQFFAVFGDDLRLIGLDPDAFLWHIAVIMTDGTSALLEGYSAEGCVLAAVITDEDGHHIVQISWSSVGDASFAETHPEMKPGQYICDEG